jgi:hypothetical protein
MANAVYPNSGLIQVFEAAEHQCRFDAKNRERMSMRLVESLLDQRHFYLQSG